ncbi:LpqB family beta-propeller domain-containing protein, partial [Acidobacteria bacterium AH-259-L09]|nr:LpqB family beta-propeller domain-containing protein [Acidobacteria bacterium AH-259-L09]
MRKDHLTIFFLVALLAGAARVTVPAAVQNESEAEAALQAAMNKDFVDGDLEAAIQQYKKILTDYTGNRRVSAKALLQMGQCYERLGSAEARKAYERIVREFPDQSEPVNRARARLAALAGNKTADSLASREKAGVIVRELQLDSCINCSSQGLFALSHDGTRVAYTKRGGNLVVRDLATLQERQVTDLKSGFAFYPVWSPDGKKIVYTAWQGNYWKYEMHIVSLETGEDQHREINGFAHDWSKDGRSILYAESGLEKPRWTLNLLPVEGGRIRQILNEDNSKRGQSPRLSPDGQYVAYFLFARASLFIVPVEGGAPIRISEGSAYDGYPIWAPDGKVLLFLSDRNLGRWDLWGLRVLEGKPSGEPFMVKPDMGRVQLFSLSENGRLLLARSELRSHIYVTEIDPDTAQAIGEAVRLTSDSTTGNGPPRWSHDGRHIAYEANHTLRVMSEDGSNDRELVTVGATLVHTYAWGPDNDHIYFGDRRQGTGAGIYSISASTKEIKAVLLDPEILAHVDVSPDGKHLVFLKGLQRQQNFHIYVADIDGKNLRQLTFETTAKVAYPAWSPDGKQIAFYKYGAGDGRRSLWLLDVDDGRLTQVFEGPNSEHTFFHPSWSPDGKRIAWSSRDGTGTPDGFELRFMGLTPGEKPKAIQPNVGSPAKLPMFYPKWAPDGKKMVFVTGTPIYQVLLME